MINKQQWMDEVIVKLNGCFGSRLLYAGLQGSYRRNEADVSARPDYYYERLITWCQSALRGL